MLILVDQPGRATRRIISPNLDLLRSIAVLCVFFSHLFEPLGYGPIGNLGQFGVILFFVHTSFVLMASLDRLDQYAASNLRLMVGFWVRRIFRIYPLSVLFILLAVAFRIPIYPGFQYHWVGLKTLLSNLALTQNLTNSPNILSVMWTLPLEIQMYVLLPFAYLFVRNRRKYSSLLLWGLSLLLALTIPHLTLRLNLFLYAPCFAAGIVAYDLVRQKKSNAFFPAWTWPAGILLCIALFRPFHSLPPRALMHKEWALSLAVGLLYANVEDIPWGKIQTIHHWIAEHSYGIYLSHLVIFWIAFDKMTTFPIWVRALTLIAAAIGAPALLYTTIEKPMIRTGVRLANHLLKTSPEATIRQSA
jgi:peptidoglycan/LPS O-acetylase OafA/YrhL